ncbi:MAG: F0F1 ATP synthase subunit B, partial [Saprospiraceae bacterium]|nr:F0F1 ATP synthase subunit B [Saprospiraceae bacterium]
GRFAFKPIAKALKDREESIDGALKSAERARAEMEALSSKNEQLLKEAKEERSKILKEANDVKNKIVAEAKEEAKVEASKILEDARKEIATQKNAAVAEIKGEVGKIAVEIAEQVLSKELTNKSDQEQLVNSLLNNVNFSKN